MELPRIKFRKRITRKAYGLLMMAGLLGSFAFWAGLTAAPGFHNALLPGPRSVLKAAWASALSADFWLNAGVSVMRVLTAFLASAALAIPLGILMSCYKQIEALCEPIIDFIRYVPVPALLPLFVLFTGIGEAPKFLVLFFGTFFQLVLLITDDANEVPAVNFDVGKTIGASNWQLIRDILVPGLLPVIFDRLRVTLGWCWTYIVIAELVAADHGLGHLIKEAQRFNGVEQMIVYCVALGIIGLITDIGAKAVYRQLFPYTAKAALISRS